MEITKDIKNMEFFLNGFSKILGKEKSRTYTSNQK